jgi:hypothetical protein
LTGAGGWADLEALAGTALLGWTVAARSRRALWLLTPMIIWMPLTLALKIWLTAATW